jgi:hypothetical protein
MIKGLFIRCFYRLYLALMYSLRWVVCLAVGITFSSCEKWYAIPTPSYIVINNYITKVNAAQQGTSNQNFTDMQITANGQTYGIYPLGTQIPVLISGQVSFVVKAVVEINGVSALRSTYQVMKGCDTIWPVQFGKVATFTPVFEYFSGAEFPWIDNFDGTSSGPALWSTCQCLTDTTTKEATPGMGGGHCLELKPNVNQTTSSVETNAPIPLLGSGTGIYLEFNYMGNVPINIAVQGLPTGGSLTAITSCGGVYPSTTWNKAYIDLTPQVSSLNSGYYYIYFTSLYDYLTANTNQENNAYIDNIKIVVAQ